MGGDLSHEAAWLLQSAFNWSLNIKGILATPQSYPPQEIAFFLGNQWVFIVPDHKAGYLLEGGWHWGGVPLGSHSINTDDMALFQSSVLPLMPKCSFWRSRRIYLSALGTATGKSEL